MDLSPRTTSTTAADEKQWVGSRHGTDSIVSLTLDVQNGGFTIIDGGDGYGYIQSGTPIKRHSSGYYRRVNTASGSEEAADYHLWESVRVKVGVSGTYRVGGQGFWHGVVIAAKVPGAFPTLCRVAKNVLYR